MHIPPEVRIPFCIEQGCVFNFLLSHADPTKNRYFVVLNANPKTDLVLIMVTPTKQVEKKYSFIRRNGISKSTIVMVSPKEYSIFKVDSAFNCNDVHEVAMSDLIRKIKEGGSMNFPKMTSAIITKLIRGVKNSPNVSLVVKNLL